MSSSTMPTTPPLASPMRQQLDELDALLQRMLSLPVNSLSGTEDGPVRESPLPPRPVKTMHKFFQSAEQPSSPPKPVADTKAPLPPPVDETPAPPRGATAATPVPASAAATSMEPSPGEEATSVVSTPSIVLPSVAPMPRAASGKARETPRAREWAPPLLPADAQPEETIIPEKPSPFLARHEARLREQHRMAPWLVPLSWINGLFDRCAIALGRPGLWLVRSEARELLGWMGMGLLVAAAIILVGDWFGWTW